MLNTNSSMTVALVLVAMCTTVSASAQSDNIQAARSGDPIAGKEKSQLCQGCHGEDGNSPVTPVPKLAGQNAGYIMKQVRNFQAGTRKHAIMNDLAATVNDDDMLDIAAYFSSREKMKGDGSGNAVGKAFFLNGDPSRMISACVNCHGANGKGLEPNPAMIPVIGGQHEDYLKRQLVNFRDGDRSNSPDGVMNGITKPLTDTELEALAEYISGL